MATNNNKYCKLPFNRVKTIMKSSPDVKNISRESVLLVAKATELFIQCLAKESLTFSTSTTELTYDAVSKIVDRDQKLEFLRELIPKKITIKEYKNMLRKANKKP